MLTETLTNLVQTDTDLLLAINGLRAQWADSFMYAFSGKLIWIPMYAAIVYAIFRNLYWKTALWCLVGVAFTILFADQVCATVIRPWVMRLRPSNLGNPVSEFVQIVNGYRGGAYGFPSCHAANTFGLACFVWLVFRKRWLTVYMMGWAVITCYSRAYLGVHYPGDLLVGGLVGAAGGTLAYYLFVKVSKYRRSGKMVHYYIPVYVGGLTIVGIFIYALIRSFVGAA